MQPNTLELKTQSGYVVTIKRAYLTYGERVELQKLYIQNSKIDINTKAVSEIDAGVMFKVNELVFRTLVTSVTTPDGKVAEDKYNAIMDSPEADGKEIFDWLNTITNPDTETVGEKK